MSVYSEEEYLSLFSDCSSSEDVISLWSVMMDDLKEFQPHISTAFVNAIYAKWKYYQIIEGNHSSNPK